MSEDSLAPVKLAELGRVEKPHGLRGELCIDLYADSPFLFDTLTRVYLRLPGKKPRACRVLSWRPHQGRALVLLDRAQGRDQAEAWRGAEVLARIRDLPPDEEGSMANELLGLPVWHVDGTRIGTLEDIQDVAGQELWFILDAEGHEILLPAVPEFVREIDIDGGRILVAPPEGLLDIYRHP